MAAKLSTGLKDFLLAGGSLTDAFQGGTLIIYGGAEPASANDTPSFYLVICDQPLDFLAPDEGVMSKNGVLSGTVDGDGVATHFRMVQSGDPATNDPTQIRVQGTIGVAGADLVMLDTELVDAAPFSIDVANITFQSA